MDRNKFFNVGVKWCYILFGSTHVGFLVLDFAPVYETLVLSFSTTHPFCIYEITGVGN